MTLRPAWPRLPALQAVPTKFFFAAATAGSSVGAGSSTGIGSASGNVRGGSFSGGIGGGIGGGSWTTGSLGAQLAIAAWWRSALDSPAGVARLRYG
jgi:hypothetical protein